MKQQVQTVIIVTAYGEDNYYQKQYEDVVGIYTTLNKAIAGAMADGMTRRQLDYLRRAGMLYSLSLAMTNNKDGESAQVDYEEETDKRRKKCESSYMFQTYNLD